MSADGGPRHLARLLKRLRQSTDEQAWAQFAQRYTPLIWYWARRWGLQEHDAADLVQDVLLVLVRKLPQFIFRQHKSFRGWLRKVTLNKWRENGRRAQLPYQPGPLDADDLAGGNNVQDGWEVQHRHWLAVRALKVMQAEFEPASWQAFWNMVVVGHSAAQVAQQLGISVGAVYVAKFRVLARLRQELNGFMD